MRFLRLAGVSSPRFFHRKCVSERSVEALRNGGRGACSVHVRSGFELVLRCKGRFECFCACYFLTLLYGVWQCGRCKIVIVCCKVLSILRLDSNVNAGLFFVHVLCAVLLCLARICIPVLVKCIVDAAAGLRLVRALCAVLLTRFCNPALVKRIVNAAVGFVRDEMRWDKRDRMRMRWDEMKRIKWEGSDEKDQMGRIRWKGT